MKKQTFSNKYNNLILQYEINFSPHIKNTLKQR
jgi:hypothetical protein